MTVTPVLVLVAIGVVAFGFWRAFRLNRRYKSSAQNNWSNENFSAREATGSWAEDILIDGESTAPKIYPGQGSGSP